MKTEFILPLPEASNDRKRIWNRLRFFQMKHGGDVILMEERAEGPEKSAKAMVSDDDQEIVLNRRSLIWLKESIETILRQEGSAADAVHIVPIAPPAQRKALVIVGSSLDRKLFVEDKGHKMLGENEQMVFAGNAEFINSLQKESARVVILGSDNKLPKDIADAVRGAEMFRGVAVIRML